MQVKPNVKPSKGKSKDTAISSAIVLFIGVFSYNHLLFAKCLEVSIAAKWSYYAQPEFQALTNKEWELLYRRSVLCSCLRAGIQSQEIKFMGDATCRNLRGNVWGTVDTLKQADLQNNSQAALSESMWTSWVCFLNIPGHICKARSGHVQVKSLKNSRVLLQTARARSCSSPAQRQLLLLWWQSV